MQRGRGGARRALLCAGACACGPLSVGHGREGLGHAQGQGVEREAAAAGFSGLEAPALRRVGGEVEQAAGGAEFLGFLSGRMPEAVKAAGAEVNQPPAAGQDQTPCLCLGRRPPGADGRDARIPCRVGGQGVVPGLGARQEVSGEAHGLQAGCVQQGDVAFGADLGVAQTPVGDVGGQSEAVGVGPADVGFAGIGEDVVDDAAELAAAGDDEVVPVAFEDGAALIRKLPADLLQAEPEDADIDRQGDAAAPQTDSRWMWSGMMTKGFREPTSRPVASSRKSSRVRAWVRGCGLRPPRHVASSTEKASRSPSLRRSVTIV